MEDSEISSMKEELIEHINKNFPEDKKDSAIEQILSMNDQEFIEFLRSNNLLKDTENCVFCSIVSDEIPSTIIAENEDALAILEINPISEGHIIIIPKKHISQIDQIENSIKEFAEEIKNLIQKKLNPKRVEIFYSEAFNHQIINILPIYSDENPNSKRNKLNLEELEKIRERLTTELKEERKDEEVNELPKKEILDSSRIRVPRRFP